MRMSLKMENFCRAYVLGGVAKTAALEAGYSTEYARCRSHELLDHMGVRLTIEQLRWEMREHNSGDADAGGGFSYDEPRWRQRYLEVLWAVASTSMEELIVDGEMVEPEPGSLAWWAIKRWKQVPDGKGGVKPQIELHNRMPALREFGKATGFNVPLALQPTGKMGWKGPFSPFGPATMKDAFDPPTWREMEKEAAAAAGAARQGVGGETDKNRAFEGGSDRGIEGGGEFDRNMGDEKNGQSGMPITDRGFGIEKCEMKSEKTDRSVRSDAGPASATGVAGGATDKNRGFGPMFEEAGPQGGNREWTPMDANETAQATDKNRGFEGGSDRGIEGGGEFDRNMRDEKNGQSGMPITDRGFGECATVEATDKDRHSAPHAGEDASVPRAGEDASVPRAGEDAGVPRAGEDAGVPRAGEDAGGLRSNHISTMPAETPAFPGDFAPVVRTWTQQVAMLKGEPVQVLEMLVVGLVKEPMWQGKLLPVSQRQAMITELLQAVPYEVAVKLVTRLEAEEGVSVIRC